MPLHEAWLRELIKDEDGQYHHCETLFVSLPDRERPRDPRVVCQMIATLVAGFANADGGVLVLGVEDGVPTGHGYPNDIVRAMLTVPQEHLLPSQAPGYGVVIDGVELLVFEVADAPRAVRTHGNDYPYRCSYQTVNWDEEKITAIKNRGRGSAEAQPSSVEVSALDGSRIMRAIEACRHVDASPEDYLVRRQLARWNGQALELSEAAVLLFAERPETIASPNAGVRMFRVTGKARLADSSNVEELARIQGNLPDVLEEVARQFEPWIDRLRRLFLALNLAMQEHAQSVFLEAVVNAVAHRDYAVQSQAVEIWMFDDRVEIFSPGTPLPGVALELLRARRPEHASRNPRIARVLTELHLMREQGAGIPHIIEEMERLFMPLPTFDVDGNRFRVILYKDPIFRSDDLVWVRSVCLLPISLGQRRAMMAFGACDFTAETYAALNATDLDAAHRALQELGKRGLLAVASDDGTRYRVIRGAVATQSIAEPMARLNACMIAVGFITNRDVRDAFGLDRDRAKTKLVTFVREGLLIRQGEKRGAHYRPGAKWPFTLA